MATFLLQIVHFLAEVWARLGLAGSWDGSVADHAAREDAAVEDRSPTDSGTHPAVAQRQAWAKVQGAPKAPRAPWLEEQTPPSGPPSSLRPSWRPGMA